MRSLNVSFGTLFVACWAACVLAVVGDPLSMANSPDTISTRSDVTCKNGVHVIVARASLELPGYGVMGSLKNLLLAVIPDSDAVAVSYPASIVSPVPYIESVPQGVSDCTQLVQEYGDACPGHPMVLMGYSQGAQVVADTLIGSNYTTPGVYPETTGLSSTYLASILAVVLMGDPSSIPNLSINVGNATRSGSFPRANADRWTSTGLANRTVSYCDADDTFCASGILGGISLTVHAAYIPLYQSQAANFVNERWATYVQNNSPSNPSGSSPTGMTTTTSASQPTQTGAAGASKDRRWSLPSLFWLILLIPICTSIAGNL